MSENQGGDVLARGGVRATFTTGAKVSQQKWDSIFNPEPEWGTEVGDETQDETIVWTCFGKVTEGTDEPKDSRSDSDAQKTRDAGVDAGASVPDGTGF